MMHDTLGSWLAHAKQMYGPQSETAALEAAALAANILGVSRSWVAANPEELLSEPAAKQLDELLTQLVHGNPLPYLTGEQEFFGLTFYVTRDVLIPRPETELLVEEALKWLSAHAAPARGLDICTGSGCAAVAICANQPSISMTAVDLSAGALTVARKNVVRHRLGTRIDLVLADLTSPLAGTFQLITANPPYIPTPRLERLKVSRHEPTMALDGGEEGLDIIRRLLVEIPDMLGIPGLVLCEIDETHGDAVLFIAEEIFPNAASTIVHDLADKPRLLRIETVE